MNELATEKQQIVAAEDYKGDARCERANIQLYRTENELGTAIIACDGTTGVPIGVLDYCGGGATPVINLNR